MKKTLNEQLEILRHSAAHLLAHALFELYPGTKFTLGPATETGFFYDFLPEENIKEEELALIEEKMREISARNYPLTHKEISKEEARKLYKDNPFKQELIEGIPGDTVGIAEQGNFYDLCRGGHVSSTGCVKHFTLLHISGSYWRANRNNQVLQRISGTAFLTAEDLSNFLIQREEAQKYDHRRIGKELDLFSFQKEGTGFPFFHPKGKTVINILANFMRKITRDYNYQEVATPMMLSNELWKCSGHYAHYKENMYFSAIDEEEYAIKPMNCPGAFLIYKNRPRSYRELPLKIAEFGHVHRHELSGVLHGLMRVRAFTIDDAHIFCTLEQLEDQIVTILKIISIAMNKMGFTNLSMCVATRPKNSLGTDTEWNTAIAALENGLKKAGYDYKKNEGDGAFYGPKIEVHMIDSLGRSWQCGTVQVDFFQSQNFDMTYTASSGKKERPVVIHQAIFGSFERFFAILLEHYKGKLPFWLSPVQARILPITNNEKEYAHNITLELRKKGYRIEIDETTDSLSSKIKSAQYERIPWMLVIGPKEAESQTITLRHLDGSQEIALTLDEIIKKAELIS